MAKSEYRKKLLEKYGANTTTKEEEEEKKVSAGSDSKASSSSTTQKTSSTTKKSSVRQKLLEKYNADTVDTSGVNKWFSDAKSTFDSIQKDSTKDYSEKVDSLLDSSNDIYKYLYNHKDEIDNFDEWDKALSEYRSGLLQIDHAYYREENNPVAKLKSEIDSMSADEIKQKMGSTEVKRMENAQAALSQMKEGMTPFDEYAEDLDYVVKKYKLDTDLDLSSQIYELYMSVSDDGDGSVAYYDDNGDAITWDSLYRTKSTEESIAKIQSMPKLKTAYDELVSYRDDIKRMENAQAALEAEKEGVTVFDEYAKDLDYIVKKYNLDTSLDLSSQIYDVYMALGEGVYQGQKDNEAILKGAGYNWDDFSAYYKYFEDKEKSANLQKSYELVAKNYPFLADLTSVVAAPGQITDMLTDTVSAIKNVGTKDSSMRGLANVYDNNATSLVTTLMSQRASDIKDDVVNATGMEWLGSTVSAAYSGIISMAQSASTGVVATALFGPKAGATIAAGILGSQAGASGYVSAVKNGSTVAEAFAFSFASALNESLGEWASLSKLLNFADKLDVTSMSKLLKSMGKGVLWQGITEASEEGVTETLNNLADWIINGDHSSYKNAIGRYMQAGYSEEEAEKLASKEHWEEFASALVGGMFGGFASGTGAAVINSPSAIGSVKERYNDLAKTYKGTQDKLVTEAGELGLNIDKYQKRLDKGKELSGGQLSNLVDAKEKAITTNNVQKVAEELLTDFGEDGDVSAVSKALAKQFAGEKLSKSEKQLIANSKYGQRVANELDTDRISVIEYSRLLEALKPNEEATDSADEQVVELSENEAGSTEFEAEAIAESEIEEVQESEVLENAVEEAQEVEAEESKLTIEDASKKYGAQAAAMIHSYHDGQDIAKYDTAYGIAYNMGKSGVSLSYAMNSEATSYLTEEQRELAYRAGEDSANTSAAELDSENKKAANGNTGRRKGTVKGEGVTIADLKQTFNDTQNTAYKLLSTYAEATGIDIVLYRSEANSEGIFEGAQGRFRRSEPGTIYIDVNAGLDKIKNVDDLAKYTMLRTFSHEFIHFIEKWNPIQYNEFRKLVFDTLTERGENVHDLIEEKQSKNPGMDYDKASREVVAEAMTDILPDSNFIQDLAENHKTIFDKLLEKLKEFVSRLRAYYNSIGHNRSREANALKEQVGDAVHYVENIVKMFDKVALEAVENYQKTVATEEVAIKSEKVDSTDTISAEKNASSDEESGDYGNFTITDNAEFGSLEIKFDGKPSEAIRNVLKENKFRWHNKKGIWYGKGERADIIKALRAAYEAEAETDNNGLTDDETAAILEYKSSGSYLINAKLREGIELEEHEQKLVDDLDKALEKLPVYKGEVYRNIQFDGFGDGEARDEYVAMHVIGETIPYNAYTSSSTDKDGYPLSGDFVVHHVIQSTNGRNMEGYGNNFESEVLFSRTAYYVTDRIEYDSKGTPTIYLTEVSNEQQETGSQSVHGRGIQGDNQGDTSGKPGQHETSDISDKTEVQRLRTHDSENGEMQSVVSERNTASDNDKQGDLQGVQAEVNWDDVYERLRNPLSRLPRFYTDGYLFRVYKNGEKWQGHIDAATQQDGYEISNARGVHYKSEIYSNRADAVEDIISVARNNKLLEAITQTENNTEEVINHGKYVDNQGAAQQSDTDRQGNSRLLDEVETGDVQGDVQGGDTLGDSVERGQEAGRDDNRSDAERVSRGSSEGSSESGDLRRDDGLTEEEASKAAEKLHEEVKEQIEQQSTEKPKGRNFIIGDSLDLPNGEKARYKANIEAIRLVKKLETEGRYATEAEQTILSKYVGWGGLANAFDEKKAEWTKEFKELKELLTDEEYSLARGSTLNAHYTDISVIKAMYDGLNKLGFNGGRMLEPSSGVGNFVGAMPAEMSAKVKSWTMVELDSITGLIAKYLYPNADVRIQGFEKANIPNNYMDVAISNVPFGNYAITDKAYPKKVTSAIHNYFFAKTLDKVRPGGIVMFITSSYTMNSKDSTVRRYIMNQADLLGAIRLPDTAFKGNAGTEVVTDILILKKREANTDYAGEDFLEAPYRYINGYNGANINSYFDTHPEMVLGTPSMDGGMYRSGSLTYKPLEGKGSLADQISEAFSHISGKMDYPAQPSKERTNFAVERASKKTKQGGLVSKDGKIYKNDGGNLVEQSVPAKTAERITGLLEIRDAARDLQNYLQQGVKESEVKKARQKLNKLYDDFVKKNGFINAPANRSALADDPDRYSVLALENYDSDKKTATKSDIFSKNTIAPNRTVTSAKDVSEGLIVSRNETGSVDVSLIARLTGKTEEDVTRELIDSRQAFKNRDGELEAAEVYLSGNVRAKLRDAEALLPIDPDYQNNIESLKAVMPEDVPYQDIFVNPGTPWIPSSVYSDFAAYMLGSRNTEWSKSVDVTRNPETGNFTVELKNNYLKHNASNTQKWGTPRRSFLDLFDAMLNSRSVVVKYKTDDGQTVVDKDATAAANEKIENITKEFQEWLWRDEARRTELSTLYNETFNSVVTPKYNGDNLTVNGANAMKPLRPHQRDAVQRVISSGGNTLLAHKVGAGKTYEMAAAAMKLKQLGLVKKPLFAVPKSLVAQWGTEFIDFFPTAKLLVAEATDFTATNRKIFANRIANGDYDAVIVSYEQFEKLPISDDFARDLYQEQINSIIRAIEEAKAEKGGKSLSVKDLEKKRKSLQAKIDKLTDKAKDEDNIEFEQLGVDSLFIDEAHNFKNLFYTTSMTNVAGLGNKDGSKRAFDLYTKVRYLQKLNGGRGIVFATATPVMNSMSEMYIMQKYLQPDLLEQLGLSTFDAWAKQFGEVVNGVEIKPSGQGYRVKQSFSRFKNMSELQLLFRNFADVLTDIPGLKIPKMKGGKVNVVVCEPGQFQQDYMKELEERADNIKNVDPSVDNMLKITSDGRKISYTQRMIDPTLPYEEGCKIFRCADNVARVYKENSANKGTQLIFCDMATPKGKSKAAATEAEDVDMDMESAKLYDDIKSRLVKNGIPAKEIAFIHEADTDQKKKKLFADVNEGKVRVLIGSTGKMGVGMNAQKRIVAIHHLDAPWRPGDVEQRNGRAYRQGNINDEVENFTYVTEGSFDARLWDILERKQNFINQVMNGENVGRETEDTGEVTLSAAEVKALASGSPLIMEQVQLDTDIKKLESLRRAHVSSVANAKMKLEADKGNIVTLEKYIEAGKADLKNRVDTYSEGKFSLTVGKGKYTDKKDAGTALMTEAMAKAKEDGYTTIGTFAGFDLRVIKTHEGIKGIISGKQGYPFNTYPGNTTYMINHIIAAVEGISDRVEGWSAELTNTRNDMAEQEKLIAAPFTKQAELDSKKARYNEVMEILNPKEEQSLDSIDDDSVQEQSREYLNDEEQEQQRTSPLTNREVLAMAARDVKIEDLTDGEKDALSIFQKRLSKLEELQEQRDEQGRLYKEQQFGAKVDREAASATLNRMRILDDQIKTANDDLFTIEEKAVLRQVLQKARNVVEQTEREHGQEILKRWRDRRNNAAAIKKYRDRLRGDVNDLTNWIISPNNKDITKHVPDALKNTVIPFLSSINFMSKRALKGGNATVSDKEFIKRMDSLKAAIKTNIDVNGMYSGYNDLPPDFMESMQHFIDTAKILVEKSSGEFIINQMTSEEIKDLSKIVRTLKKYITQLNRFHNNAMYQHVYEAGDNSIEFLKELGNAGNTGAVSNFLLWQQIRPAYAFERFGEGGKAIYDGLRRGQAKLAFNTKEIERFAKKAYTDKEVSAWEDEIKTFQFGGDVVKIPVSYIMGLYELYKDPDGKRHIDEGGIRVAVYKRNGEKYSDNGHILTIGNVNQLFSSLTERQKEVADTLQKFMAEQGGKWGNYVSVARFGEELFTNKSYYPINSDGRHLQANTDEQPSAASLYALLNMSFTKSRNEEANNRVVIYSIFDVFANHMASMAQYNAMALPILDALKWYNYEQVLVDENGKKTVLNSVRERMTKAYGVPEEAKPGRGNQGYAESFVVNIIKAFNGTAAQGTPYDSLGLKSLRRYNMAQVAYNFRVVVQQPMAITRAGTLLDYRSIIKGLKLKPEAIRNNISEMQEHSGIAAWKSLGFYDVNISRGLTQVIKHDYNTLDKISDVGMWGAEKADVLTWAAIWSASKEEVIKKQHLTPESDGFYEAVTELFEDVIYKTQVVDSILTKNEFMRDKGTFARAVGSFMSEPTTNASMIINAFDKYNLDIRRGMTKTQAWQKNKRMIGRVAYVYAVGAVLLAAVQAVADAFRDDDEYEEWSEKWLEAFTGNLIDELMPFNKLPIMSDFYDLAKQLASIFGADTYGNPPQSVFMQWYDSLVKGVEIISDKILGEDTNYTWYSGIFKLLQASSGMTGLPMAAATREIITAWNNIVGAMAPSLKVKSYDAGPRSEIKFAYQDGYLTAEEATKELISNGLVDNEDEAYFIIKEWDDPSGDYSKYDEIFNAVRNSGNIDTAMDELISHGYTEKEVLSQVKSKIGEWYKDGSITKQQATNMLTKYFDMDSDEITSIVNKWSSKVVTGIAFEDIKDEYLSGNITASRAIDMYVRYGGYTRDEAYEKVAAWNFEQKHGYEYSNRAEQFKKGNISANTLINIMINDGGMTDEEARSSLVSYTKAGYKEGYFTRSEAAKIMVEYGKISEDKAETKVQHIDFQKEYPGYELTETQVADYYNELEYTGLGVPEYAEYLKLRKNVKGTDNNGDGKTDSGSVKAAVMAVIDSLPITYSQKDALYYLNGWTESKIHEAPWH